MRKNGGPPAGKMHNLALPRQRRTVQTLGLAPCLSRPFDSVSLRLPLGLDLGPSGRLALTSNWSSFSTSNSDLGGAELSPHSR